MAALNMDRIKAKLSSFDKTKKGAKKETSEQQEKVKKYIWKPEPGKQTIRIVPSQFTPDFPFTELKWHYELGGRSYLSPASQGKPDPIVELANKLERSKDTWLKGRRLQPKSRTYVPILIRGREEEGVKFWGFGVQVYEQLLAAISEPEFGDLTDLVNGFDIQIDFKTAEEARKDYPETKILIKPKQRPVIDPEHPKVREILELVTKKQPDIFDIYTPATYEELAAALEIKLEDERNGVSAGSAPRGAERTATVAPTRQPAPVAADDDDYDDSGVTLPTEEAIAANAPAAKVTEVVAQTSNVSPTAQKAKKAASVEDFEAAFANIFPAKK
jgi:hypothetical protein